MKDIWLSILLPVYNVSDFIEECIDSITSQDLDGVEVIFLDDCSTDDSLVKLERKIRAYSQCNFRLVRHDRNKGLSAARNSLLMSATGNYVWFVDSDDLLCQSIIKKIRGILDKTNPDLLFIDFIRMFWDGPATQKYSRSDKKVKTFHRFENQLGVDPEMLFSGLYFRRQMYSWCKISKRHLWTDLRFPEGRFFEDISTTPLLFLRAKSYFYLPEPGIYYRQREGSILANMNDEKIIHRITALDGVLSKWLEKYPFISTKSLYFFYRFGLKNYFLAMNDLDSRCRSDATSKILLNLAIDSMNTSGVKIFKCLLMHWDFKLIFKLLKIKLSF